MISPKAHATPRPFAPPTYAAYRHAPPPPPNTPAHLINAHLKHVLKLEVEGLRLDARHPQLVGVEDRHVSVVEDEGVAQVVVGGAVVALLACGPEGGRCVCCVGGWCGWEGGVCVCVCVCVCARVCARACANVQGEGRPQGDQAELGMAAGACDPSLEARRARRQLHRHAPTAAVAGGEQGAGAAARRLRVQAAPARRPAPRTLQRAEQHLCDEPGVVKVGQGLRVGWVGCTAVCVQRVVEAYVVAPWPVALALLQHALQLPPP